MHISDTLQQYKLCLGFPVQMITSSHLRLNERMADILRPFDIPLTIELFDVGSSVRWWFVTYTRPPGGHIVASFNQLSMDVYEL